MRASTFGLLSAAVALFIYQANQRFNSAPLPEEGHKGTYNEQQIIQDVSENQWNSRIDLHRVPTESHRATVPLPVLSTVPRQTNIRAAPLKRETSAKESVTSKPVSGGNDIIATWLQKLTSLYNLEGDLLKESDQAHLESFYFSEDEALKVCGAYSPVSHRSDKKHKSIQRNCTYRIHGLFKSNMVIQRDIPFCIFGNGNQEYTAFLIGEGERKHEYVTLDEVKATALPHHECQWRACFPARQASTASHRIEITSGNKSKQLTVMDGILFGDVFLCSGQSNMDQKILTELRARPEGATDRKAREVFLEEKRKGKKTVTFITETVGMKLVETVVNTSQRYLRAATACTDWFTPNSASLARWSALCYKFGKELYAQVNSNGGPEIPIGLLKYAVGGTAVHRFMGPSALRVCEGQQHARAGAEHVEFGRSVSGRASVRAALKFVEQNFGESAISEQRYASMHYTRLRDIVSMVGLKSALWYQGEADAHLNCLYVCRLRAFFEQLREQAGPSPFPVVSVLLATTREQIAGGMWPYVREAQIEVQRATSDFSILVPAHDLGEPRGSIHPPFKGVLALRLASAVLRSVYRGGKWKPPTINSGKAVTTLGDTLEVHLKWQAHNELRFAGTYQCDECCHVSPFAVYVPTVERNTSVPPPPTVGVCEGIYIDKGQWQAANYSLQGHGVVLRIHLKSALAFSEVLVRYQWEDQPQCGFIDKEGIPMLPFQMSVTVGQRAR